MDGDYRGYYQFRRKLAADTWRLPFFCLLCLDGRSS